MTTSAKPELEFKVGDEVEIVDSNSGFERVNELPGSYVTYGWSTTTRPKSLIGSKVKITGVHERLPNCYYIDKFNKLLGWPAENLRRPATAPDTREEWKKGDRVKGKSSGDVYVVMGLQKSIYPNRYDVSDEAGKYMGCLSMEDAVRLPDAPEREEKAACYVCGKPNDSKLYTWCLACQKAKAEIPEPKQSAPLNPGKLPSSIGSPLEWVDLKPEPQWNGERLETSGDGMAERKAKNVVSELASLAYKLESSGLMPGWQFMSNTQCSAALVELQRIRKEADKLERALKS